MILCEKEFSISVAPGHKNLLTHLAQAFQFRLHDGSIPLRFAITESDEKNYKCEVGVLEDSSFLDGKEPDSIFHFVPRGFENNEKFNAVFLIPTGIGCEIGGHAGDATPVAKLLAESCDTLVLHPNVVNASDINESPKNALYVEGSDICRLLMGTIGLQPVRSNKVLVVIDAHKDNLFVNAAINAVNAARASYGLNCPRVIQLDPPVKMKSEFSESGRAVGTVENIDYLCEVLEEYRDEFDAVALSSVISVPHSYHQDYFDLQGEMVNPWGGVEAILTHAISSIFDVPSAHSPMFETQEIANVNPGTVDPRMAAEAISLSFLQCIFKGLQRSPKIITDEKLFSRPGIISASDISCLVIPDGCLGLPTIAALEQGIPVIAIKENKNLMKNDLHSLPWASGQFHRVESYLEAVGIMNTLKIGITPESVRRPLGYVKSGINKKDAEVQEKKKSQSV